MGYVRLVSLAIVPKSSIRFMLVVRECINTTSNSKPCRKNSMYDPILLFYDYFLKKSESSSSSAQKKKSRYTYSFFFLLFSNLAHPHRTSNLRLRHLHRQTHHPPPIPPSILPRRNTRCHFLDLPCLNLAQLHLLRHFHLSPHLFMQTYRKVLETVDQGR